MFRRIIVPSFTVSSSLRSWYAWPCRWRYHSPPDVCNYLTFYKSWHPRRLECSVTLANSISLKIKLRTEKIITIFIIYLHVVPAFLPHYCSITFYFMNCRSVRFFLEFITKKLIIPFHLHSNLCNYQNFKSDVFEVMWFLNVSWFFVNVCCLLSY
jgi:hypothetical protein